MTPDSYRIGRCCYASEAFKRALLARANLLCLSRLLPSKRWEELVDIGFYHLANLMVSILVEQQEIEIELSERARLSIRSDVKSETATRRGLRAEGETGLLRRAVASQFGIEICTVMDIGVSRVPVRVCTPAFRDRVSSPSRS